MRQAYEPPRHVRLGYCDQGRHPKNGPGYCVKCKAAAEKRAYPNTERGRQRSEGRRIAALRELVAVDVADMRDRVNQRRKAA